MDTLFISFQLTRSSKWYRILPDLTSETMKLLGSTKRKMAKDKINENLAHLKTAKVVLLKKCFPSSYY